LLAGRGFRGSGDAGPQHLVVTRFQEYQDGNPLSYVSHLIENGVDPLFVQQQVGHSWASTTAVYTHVGADAKNRMLRAALDGVLHAQQDGYP
jgi:integrase